MSADERAQLQAGIAALQAQRAVLGDAVVDALLAPARARLEALLQAEQPPEPAQVLKQVTILFLDVVGSTQLSQHLDPEAIGTVMDGALARGTGQVQAHGGKVLQYAGDNLLAVFGADETREDDAERAVHCGLSLLALGRTLGAEVLAAHGHPGFNVRVGLHTGAVLLGGGVDADGSIRGIAVNIAARMEQTAPPGALRISHDTYTQVRGMFEVEAQPTMVVKGVDTPVQSWLVLRAKPRSFRIGARGIEGVATRMIGREDELQVLQAAFHRVFRQRSLQAVTVVAEAGVGKSRLLYEFEAWSDARPETFMLFRGRATPQTGTRAFGLLRDILAWRFQIGDDDSVEAARRKLEDGITPLFLSDDGPELAEAHAHLLGHLIGIDWRDSRHIRGIVDDARQVRSRAFHAAAQLFRRVGAASGAPVLLQLEDLHWADDESLDFLNHLAEVNRDTALLVLAFTRPTLFERRKDWRSTEGVHQRIDLLPLGQAASRQLAGELLKRLPEVPAALGDLLTSRAGGNPFYMEELVRMLIDQGAIQARADPGQRWAVDAQRLLATQVPPTLTGVLQARLDGLPADERHALQQASVVGAVFWDQALAAVEPEAAERLPALTQRELALPRPDAQIDGLREYAFRHHLLHQVTYETVLKRHKREGHARVARWLARLIEDRGVRAGDLPGLAAEHFEQAGEGLRAAEFHARAAELAAERMAHERVLSHVDKALAWLDGEPARSAEHGELRWQLLSLREKAVETQGRRDEQALAVQALESLAEALGDDRKRAQAAARRAFGALRTADWAGLHAAAERSAQCAQRVGDDLLRLLAVRLQAAAKVLRGDVDAGRAQAREALAEARQRGLQVAETSLLNTLAIAAERQGDLVGTLELNGQCLQTFRQLGHRVNEAVCLSNCGASRVYLGDLDRAREDLDAALHLTRANGDLMMEAHVMVTLSVLALWQGDTQRARACAQAAVQVSVATRARDAHVLSELRLADAELALGHLAPARSAYARSQALAEELQSIWAVEARAGLARVALADGNCQAALAALGPLLAVADARASLEGAEYPRWVELTCWQVLSQAGDPCAPRWLERAHTALMAQADDIGRSEAGAELRPGFLHRIPHHRAILAAWEGIHPAQAASPGPG